MITQNFDFKTFRENVEKDLSEVRQSVSSLENGEWHRMHNSDPKYEKDEEDELSEMALEQWLQAAQLKIEFAYECLGLTTALKKLSEELFQYDGEYKKLQFLSAVDVFYSPIYDVLLRHLNAITSQLSAHKKDGNSITNSSKQLMLKQIIKGTPKMLTDLQIIPYNENIVRNAAYNVLVHVFPDTVKEESISKVTKTYKPDIGIRSLKTAIEYKFVDSAEEAKKAIGGIFEDIGGYGGSEDWKTFYAVLYMTDNFLTQEQIDSELRIANAPDSWKLIPLFGKGARKKRTKK
ncbi:hypothetical protein [Zobellia nedashkovskayae]|uniref:PD-(D/E)XK nuclease domain-containing protein n=1 Tax=Zobellia nedashkovskayae TaxID=2779510 RepID=UPI00188A5F1E|nr:hypothetical protein [Zobellia nedashkovskayae]